ncbi:MAG: exodeoxyribonuclease VII large subunit [Acidimicrobiales bacterium]
MDVQAERLPIEERPDALSIAALYRQVHAAVVAAFPRGHLYWVRGEIQSINDRTGHCYIDLVDPDVVRGRDTPVLKVNCWGRTWGPLKQTLARQGIVLEPGTVVTLRGRVEFYAPKAQVNFIASDIDVSALLGGIAARRAALLATLEVEGLLARNRAIDVPPVPLRVGLVASTGTEGYNDFVGQLRGSGLAFSVVLFRAGVQGPGAPASVARALRAAGESGCDLVVLVRGGGSRGDLAAFDSELVARAVASSPRPVWTGIGHTGDQSVADIVANRAFVTPTECGQEVVARVRGWWEAAAASAARIARSAATTIEAASLRDATARLRLGSATRGQLHRHAHRLQGSVVAVATHSRRRVEDAALTLDRSATRLGVCGRASLDRQHDKVAAWRRLLTAYDVERQLERGYTITLRPDGSVVRSALELTAGDRVVTRFADGRALSSVDEVEPGDTTGGHR